MADRSSIRPYGKAAGWNSDERAIYIFYRNRSGHWVPFLTLPWSLWNDRLSSSDLAAMCEAAAAA